MSARSRSATPAGRSPPAPTGYYVLSGSGAVKTVGGAPFFGNPSFSFDIARDIAVMPDGAGYVVLDGYGGLHLFGSAVRRAAGRDRPVAVLRLRHRPQRRHHADAAGDCASSTASVASTTSGRPSRLVGNAPYWLGWDIARSLSLSTDGRSMVMLDGFGAVWRFGDAVPHAATYFGWDIARDVALMPERRRLRRCSTASAAVHRFGPGTPGEVNYGYVPFDRWRGLAIRNGHVYEVRNDGFSAG